VVELLVERAALPGVFPPRSRIHGRSDLVLEGPRISPLEAVDGEWQLYAVAGGQSEVVRSPAESETAEPRRRRLKARLRSAMQPRGARSTRNP
jgi:hypothetical protein